MRTFYDFLESKGEEGKIFLEKQWIQAADKDIERRGTKGVCTGSKFGSKSCKPGSKRYVLAQTFHKIAKKRKGKKKKKD